MTVPSRRIEIDPHRAHAHAWQFSPDSTNLIQRDGWDITEVVAGETLPAGLLIRYGIDPAERLWRALKAE